MRPGPAPRAFPFQDDTTAALRPGQWALLMLAVAAGFAVLSVPAPGVPNAAWSFLQALLFPAIPLGVLRGLAGRHWRALFHRVGITDILLALGVALLNIAVTALVAVGVSRVFGANANPAFGALAHESGGGRLLFFLQTLPQLLGEELLTLLPFLCLLAFLGRRTGLSPRSAVGVAWVVSALVFGLAHLPTYQWNWAQCLLVIGSARLVLSLAYLWTRNLWVSTMAHVFNDWILFATGLVLMGIGRAAG
jgi:membrane protease YdiL (CAAX protease family)